MSLVLSEAELADHGGLPAQADQRLVNVDWASLKLD